MIPEFLNEFKIELQKYKLDFVKIAATPIKNGEKLSLTQSKFLGHPYLPIGFEYPKDQNGNPMILIAQINFSEIPPLEFYPTTGIFQLYFSSSDWYDMTDYKLIFHEDISDEPQTDFSFLTENLYEDSPVYCEHKLTFEKSVEYGSPADVRFDMAFNGKDFYDFSDELPKDQKDEIEKLIDGAGHKIGGYAYFTQSDPRDYNKNLKEDILLLQIDTDEEIMFGDSGIANIFINLNDLKERKFTNAWFNWDCC